MHGAAVSLFFGNKGESRMVKIANSDQNCSFRSNQNKSAYSLNFQLSVNIEGSKGRVKLRN